ncbi:MAG: hypothetical protein HY904_14160 [Deltaproteobacteria bacterium]|nr:hypothetical protein [Deltaproteobacteria bacterium]
MRYDLNKPGCGRAASTAAFLVAVLAGSNAAAEIKVTVMDETGALVTNGFRWLLEEDNSYGARPGVLSPSAPLGAEPGDPSFTLGVNIHRSHAPTVCAGDTAPANGVVTFPPTPAVLAGPGAAVATIDTDNCPGYDPARKYMVSVLPWHTSPTGTPTTAQTGYTQSGRNVAAGQTAVTIVVHTFAVPTAQITVIVFADTQPINSAYDQPAELGLPGFDLILSDPIDKVMQDAFANPVGTTYQFRYTTPDGRPADATGAAVPQGGPIQFVLDEEGAPVVAWLGDGSLRTCPGTTKPVGSYTGYERANCIDPYTLQPLAAGQAVIRYLVGGKYTIEAQPPPSDPDWILTSTLEGTRGVDTWPRASEPRYMITMGNLNWLTWFGFVKPVNNLASVPNPSNAALSSISGQLVYAHDMHPPLSPGLTPGLPVPYGYVGINNLNGNDEQVYTAATDPATGAFSVDGVVPGTYQLVFWDKQLNAIIDFRTLVVAPGQNIALGPVSVYGWFGRYIGSVFMDNNRNGFRDPSDPGIPSVPVNLHFTDGSVYGNGFTDADGNFSFPQVFPFWRFLVADVDFNRFRPTGLTAWVDNGGPLPLNALGAQGINPQHQPDGRSFRTQRGKVVTQAMMAMQDMTNRIDWGKTRWNPGENGGIHGIINYALTRTEEDPSTSALDPWEPGIPRVTVVLHRAVRDCARAGASVENDCWVTDDVPPFPLLTTSDSWDDQTPTGCVGADGDASQGPVLWALPEIVNGFAIPRCAETFRMWNQVRPGVMDGSYWFQTLPDGSSLPVGNYIVQVVPPPGYEVIQWGDRDIDIGDPKIPFQTQTPPCVGAAYDIPPYLRMFPDQINETDLPGAWDANGNWTYPRAAACDMKLIGLNPGANPQVDFNLFTWVPKAGRIWGTVWNDLLLEFDPRSPNASGNFGVPWIPVAVKDWSGTEVARFYTDQWGHFDGLVPTNYDIVPPMPLGLALAMYTIAPNDPGPIRDPDPTSPTYGKLITDPWFNPEYSQAVGVVREANWMFYSGRTTFIDTIVMPVAAFVSNRMPINCDYADNTPEIREVSAAVIPQTPGGYSITITAVGDVTGPNPAFTPDNPAEPPVITYRHDFGPGGTVSVGGTVLPPANVSWDVSGMAITALIPNGVSGQLVVTRGDNGRSSTVGVTLHADNPSVPVIPVVPPPGGCQGLACSVIQPAIDAAPNGAILLLGPGRYQENVNLWKPLTLQGLGPAITVIDGLAAWENQELKAAQFAQAVGMAASGTIGLVPNQASDFTMQQGSGILVAGCDPAACPDGNDFSLFSARIDGVMVTGVPDSGGILVNGYAPNLAITNNDIFLNQGSIGGGIRVGEPALVGPANPTGSSFNPNLLIDHNRISMNGSVFSGGGGVAIYGGADNYVVSNNMICGNFSAQYGGGISHFGLSHNGVISGNVLVSNESFDEGGAIHLGGDLAPGASAISLGAGSVLVSRNLIQGNKAGDDGGGIRTRMFNGLDVAMNPGNPGAWFGLDVMDNMVVNNSSADLGGGMALDDTVKVTAIGNTFVHNDSTATSSDSFGGPCTEDTPMGQVCPPGEIAGGLVTSIPAVGGISTAAHSAPLAAALAAPGGHCATVSDALCAPYSNPLLVNDIIWQNRSFYWDAAANNNLGALLPSPGRTFWDLAVYGTATPQQMNPIYSLLTDGVGAAPDSTNVIGQDPQLTSPYLNVYVATSKGSTLGNFVVATFGPNGVVGDHHLLAGSPAIGAGSGIPPATMTDFDGQDRVAPVDIGADQH